MTCHTSSPSPDKLSAPLNAVALRGDVKRFRRDRAGQFLRCLGTIAALAQTRPAQAEDSLTLKAQSWQEDDHRIRVDSQYALVEANITPDARIKVMGLIDTIAGATPTGEQPAAPGAAIPSSHMEEERKAWDANVAYQFKRLNVAVSYGVSRESDYVSNGYSINTLTDFNQKNTTLLLGWGHTDDRIMEKFWSRDRYKTGDDLIIGATQLLSPEMSVTANVSYGRSTGFMSDPYKIVSTKNLDVDPGTYYTPPENRPREKEKVSVFLGTNRHFEKLDAALDGSYRYYQDTFGIKSHTVELKWVQRAGTHFLIEPVLRYSRQSAADFYYTNLDAAGVVTSYDPLFETGTGKSPFYSSDYRLSKLETVNLGLKLGYIINDHCSLDFAYERYLMHGLDGDTPQSAYSSANVFTIGFKLSR